MPKLPVAGSIYTRLCRYVPHGPRILLLVTACSASHASRPEKQCQAQDMPRTGTVRIARGPLSDEVPRKHNMDRDTAAHC